MKKPLPPIVAGTGLSGDYTGEYYGRLAIYQSYGLTALKDALAASPVRKYLERFPPDTYEVQLGESSRPLVQRLDEIAEIVNARSFTAQEFEGYVAEVQAIVYGSDRRDAQQLEEFVTSARSARQEEYERLQEELRMLRATFGDES